MRYIILPILLAGPAAAHTGDSLHVHPHDGASWLLVASVLGLGALGGLVLARVRGKK